MSKRAVCLFCRRNVGEVRLVVNVAQEFAREAPAGVFHVDNCFRDAVARHRALNSDAEVTVGTE